VLGPEPRLQKLQALSLTGAHSRAALQAAQDAVCLARGELHSLSLRPSASGAGALIVLAGLTDEGALRLAARLRCRPGVKEVRVEHRWVRA
jgi:hypothetical protein